MKSFQDPLPALEIMMTSATFDNGGKRHGVIILLCRTASGRRHFSGSSFRTRGVMRFRQEPYEVSVYQPSL